jgi:hypothetical protein
MVALRWCEEDGPEYQERSVGPVHVLGSGPYGSARRGLELVSQPAAPLGGEPSSVARPRSVARPSQRTFFWRRVLALAVIAGLGVLALQAAGRLVGATVAGAQEPGTGQVGGQIYVARPGDTIWSIAVRYSQGGDPRPLVDKLEAEIGGGTLQPGERLAVP